MLVEGIDLNSIWSWLCLGYLWVSPICSLGYGYLELRKEAIYWIRPGFSPKTNTVMLAFTNFPAVNMASVADFSSPVV